MVHGMNVCPVTERCLFEKYVWIPGHHRRCLPDTETKVYDPDRSWTDHIDMHGLVCRGNNLPSSVLVHRAHYTHLYQSLCMPDRISQDRNHG